MDGPFEHLDFVNKRNYRKIWSLFEPITEDMPRNTITTDLENALESGNLAVIFIRLESKEEKVKKVTWNPLAD